MSGGLTSLVGTSLCCLQGSPYKAVYNDWEDDDRVRNNSVVRAYHVYKAIWTPVFGEALAVVVKDDECFAVAAL